MCKVNPVLPIGNQFLLPNEKNEEFYMYSLTYDLVYILNRNNLT